MLSLRQDLPGEQCHLPLHGGLMTRRTHETSPASVRAHLLTLAQANGEDYQRILGGYAIVRF